MNEVKKILAEAKNLIETVGWCQREYVEFDYSGDTIVAYCSLGAINNAGGLDFGFKYDAKYILSTVILPPGQINHISINSTISMWNDDKHRTKEEVIEAFDKAIELADKGIESA